MLKNATKTPCHYSPHTKHWRYVSKKMGCLLVYEARRHLNNHYLGIILALLNIWRVLLYLELQNRFSPDNESHLELTLCSAYNMNGLKFTEKN